MLTNSPELIAKCKEIREELNSYDSIIAYTDSYHMGTLEQLNAHVSQLQQAVTALVALLAANGTINLSDFQNEA